MEINFCYPQKVVCTVCFDLRLGNPPDWEQWWINGPGLSWCLMDGLSLMILSFTQKTEAILAVGVQGVLKAKMRSQCHYLNTIPA